MPVTVATTTPQREEKPCPICGEKILSIAIKCKHCGEMLDDSPPFPKLKRPYNEKPPLAQKRFVLPKSSAPVAAALSPKPTSSVGGIFLALLIGGALGYGAGAYKSQLAAVFHQSLQVHDRSGIVSLNSSSDVDLQEVIAFPDKYVGKSLESVVSYRDSGVLMGGSGPNLLITVTPPFTTDAYFLILATGEVLEKARRICAATGKFGQMRVTYMIKQGHDKAKLLDIDLAR